MSEWKELLSKCNVAIIIFVSGIVLIISLFFLLDDVPISIPITETYKATVQKNGLLESNVPQNSMNIVINVPNSEKSYTCFQRIKISFLLVIVLFSGVFFTISVKKLAHSRLNRYM